MDDPILARLMDAALPFVCGRKLRTYGLIDEFARCFEPFKDDAGAETCTLILAKSSERIQKGLEQASGVVVMLLPGFTRAPQLDGLKVVDLQYAFEDETGVADARAASDVPDDPDWAMSEVAGPVWLDTQRPDRPLGCIVIAETER